MPIILSQRVDLVSDYADKPFFRYHFPMIYRNQIKTGDIFIYYQGDRKKLENRYYFGSGVIGEITPDRKAGGGMNAEIRFSVVFPKKVRIYLTSSEGRYYECLGYKSVRESPRPAFQCSIRKLSVFAFEKILIDAGLKVHANFNKWIA